MSHSEFNPITYKRKELSFLNYLDELLNDEKIEMEKFVCSELSSTINLKDNSFLENIINQKIKSVLSIFQEFIDAVEYLFTGSYAVQFEDPELWEILKSKNIHLMIKKGFTQFNKNLNIDNNNHNSSSGRGLSGIGSGVIPVFNYFNNKELKLPSIDMLKTATFLFFDFIKESNAAKSIIKKYRNHFSPEIEEFLNKMLILQQVEHDRLTNLAPEEAAREYFLYQRFRATKQLKTEIVNLEQKVFEITKNINEISFEHQKKLEKIKNEKEEIFLNYKITEQNIDEMDETNKLIVNQLAIESIQLNEDLQKISEEYENEFKIHVIENKKHREGRYKREMNLIYWIQKYDTDYGVRYTEYEKYENELDELNYQYEEYLIEMENHNEEYEVIWAIILKEEAILLKHRIQEFILNRNARLIQKWYRQILLTHKKKKRGGRRGKKARRKK